MKFTSTILSLAALFSAASALPTPSSTTTTVVYNSTVDITTSTSESTTFVASVSPSSGWNSGCCMQITLEETDVYVTITEEESTEIDVIAVSSDVITQFLQVSVEQIEQIKSITFSAEVIEVDSSYCVA